MDRRNFLTLLTSAMALTAVGCRRPEQKIVSQPYPIEYIKQGSPYFYSSVFQLQNAAYGVQITTREGKPIKIDGNDLHPINNQSSNPKIQAELYSLYDPERFWKPKIRAKQATFDEAYADALSLINESIKNDDYIVVFHQEHCSPTFQKLIDQFEKHIPNFKFISIKSLNQSNKSLFCNKTLFGLHSAFIPQISKAELIISIAYDFLGSENFSLFYAKEYSKVKDCEQENFAKLITLESSLSLTGANSDTRIVINPNQFEGILARILLNLIIEKNFTELYEILPYLKQYPVLDEQIESKLTNEIIKYKDKVCVLVDNNLPLKAVFYAMLINFTCGSVGESKIFDPNYTEPFSTLNDLNIIDNILNSSKVSCLILADCNPLFSPIISFRDFYIAFDNQKTIALSYYPNIFKKDIAIQIPIAHFLEFWSDAVSFNNIYSIQQPVISPLNKDSVSIQEFLFKIAKDLNNNNFNQFNTYYDYLRSNWIENYCKESDWEEILKNGIYYYNREETRKVSFNIKYAKEVLNSQKSSLSTDNNKYILHLKPSYVYYDYKDIHNPILNELPNSITTISWEGAILISPSTARKLKVSNNDIIQISKNGQSLNKPILIQEGICDGVLSYDFDFSDDALLSKLNVDVKDNLYSANFYIEVDVEKTPSRADLALRVDPTKSRPNLSKVILLKDFKESYNKLSPKTETSKQLNNSNYEYLSHFWGMLIDTTKCIGCGACVVACQIENNIPIVGKDEVLINRAMHWIRIERYSNTKEQNSVFIPIMCQHCEKAPCETVCPVNATTHSPEGISEMTYNRCIGSRFCMVNCPYQVRRFNFKDYHSNENPALESLHNPEVTIRSRGVVEKCTFCIQRIIKAKYKANDEGRIRLNDGDLMTACQIACPTGAIVFGDLNNPNAKISKMKLSQHSFTMLEELNTKPSVFYLSKIQNEL